MSCWQQSKIINVRTSTSSGHSVRGAEGSFAGLTANVPEEVE